MDSARQVEELLKEALPSQWSYAVMNDGRVFFMEFVPLFFVIVDLLDHRVRKQMAKFSGLQIMFIINALAFLAFLLCVRTAECYDAF
jgi:hypothetical protein